MRRCKSFDYAKTDSGVGARCVLADADATIGHGVTNPNPNYDLYERQVRTASGVAAIPMTNVRGIWVVAEAHAVAEVPPVQPQPSP